MDSPAPGAVARSARRQVSSTAPTPAGRSPAPGRPGSGRIRSLDSLRGVAALVVVLYHFSLIVPGVHPRLTAIYPLRPLLAGEAAVYLFFVLSGFVLFLSLEHHGRERWPAFAVRRLVRLYPPVAVAVLASAGLYLLVQPGPLPALAGWLTQYSWTEAPGPALLAGHLLLLDGDRFHSLDNPMWSLVVEVRLSLLFPFVVAALRRRPAMTTIGCVVVSLMARAALHHEHAIGAVDPFFTLQFLGLFALGAATARYRAEVAERVRRVPGPLVVVAALVTLGAEGRWALPGMYAAALLLVAASLSYPVLERVYGFRPLVWLGERSFSLYLVHIPLLLAAVHGLAGRMPIALVLAGVFPLCLMAAELFWLAVERPSIALTRRVGGGVRRPAEHAPVEGCT